MGCVETATPVGSSDPSLQDDPAVVARLAEWRDRFWPGDAVEAWLFRSLVVTSVRQDRLYDQEMAVRRYDARRAEVAWDDDRTEAVETIAAGLAKRPALVAARLRKTKHGCLWLRDRWKALGVALRDHGAWTDAQTSLAFDLLGTPPDERRANPWPPGDTASGLVVRQLAAIEARLSDALNDLDDRERAAAVSGSPVRPSRELARVQRDADKCRRHFEWCWDQLDRLKRQVQAAAPPAPPSAPPAEHPPEPVVDPLPSRAKPDPDLVEAYQAYERAVLARLMEEAMEPSETPAPAVEERAVVHPARVGKSRPNRRERRAAKRFGR